MVEVAFERECIPVIVETSDADCKRARARIGAYLRFYNNERPHQALDSRTPAQVFEEGRNQVHQTDVTVTSQLVPA